jgi:hypothetical protein
LLITENIEVSDDSTAMFIVSGKVEVEKKVDRLGVAIITDQDFYSAYDITEGETTKTLDYSGIYMANKFLFQRTLQGTNNQKDPSDNFVFEPKYLIQLRSYFGKYDIIWRSVE